eukprot:m.318083 g.318083  ORF g.318083 m.318083 type:complete len:336 (+) comp15989_c0_seq15:100-1107(+)
MLRSLNRIMASASITLNNGKTMPQVGLGTWKAGPGVVATAVEEAIKAGYRHIDGACDYGNEKEVGQGIQNAIAAGVCTREDLFVTSKLWNTFHKKENVQPACEKTLSDLGLAYVDLYLVHFPISLKFVPFETRYPPEWIYDPSAAEPKMIVDPVPMSETWSAMESLVDQGLAKSIGVSNFSTSLLADLLSYARIKPAVNQVEIHPYLTQENLVRFCKMNDVAITSYSPLGAGSYVSINGATEDETIFKDATMASIAEAHKKSIAQVALRWAVQQGFTTVPKSSQVERIKQNIDVFDFELTEDEMKAIAGLNRNRRFNDPAAYCGAAFGQFWSIFD